MDGKGVLQDDSDGKTSSLKERIERLDSYQALKISLILNFTYVGHKTSFYPSLLCYGWIDRKKCVIISHPDLPFSKLGDLQPRPEI